MAMKLIEIELVVKIIESIDKLKQSVEHHSGFCSPIYTQDLTIALFVL
ncbi:MAG: hypothetical protein ACFFFB_21955 [Candidatus Heimdallarchaeota archaeon]